MLCNTGQLPRQGAEHLYTDRYRLYIQAHSSRRYCEGLRLGTIVCKGLRLGNIVLDFAVLTANA